MYRLKNTKWFYSSKLFVEFNFNINLQLVSETLNGQFNHTLNWIQIRINPKESYPFGIYLMLYLFLALFENYY